MATLSVTAVTTAHAQFANNLNVVGQVRLVPGSAAGSPGGGFPLFVDFLSGNAFPPGATGVGQPGNVFSGFVNGAFAGLMGSTNGVIQDLTVSGNGAAPTLNPAGNANFLQIGGYAFTLGNPPAGVGPSTFTLADVGGSATASFTVFGLVTGPGFATATAYQGVFTAQFAGQSVASVLANGTQPVTFSANFGAPVGPASTVPEPSTYALMAAGLGGLGFAVRRRRTQA